MWLLPDCFGGAAHHGTYRQIQVADCIGMRQVSQHTQSAQPTCNHGLAHDKSVTRLVKPAHAFSMLHMWKTEATACDMSPWQMECRQREQRKLGLAQHLIMGSIAVIAAKTVLASTLINCRCVPSVVITAIAVGCCDIDLEAIGHVDALIQNVCLCI